MSDPAHTLLIVDDDPAWRESAAGALRRRGFEVSTALTVDQAATLLQEQPPRYALIDLRIGDESGLVLVEQAARVEPPIQIVVLTGYASIATAVEAVKLGATHYLAKPARVDDIVAALTRDRSGDVTVPLPEEPPSVRRLEWEHIHRVLRQHGGNISATARALNMHRRTLQRKLAKHPVKR
ncbi:MAG TPA: response regulator transcription factor [Gammaproteobacteria bacterium]|nr:response regulator transcription factor [Gammaproteobacteria bacterium]